MTPPAPPDPWIAAARGLAEAWPGVVTGDAPAVHRARVATRRLREALPVLDGERRGLRRLRKDLRGADPRAGPGARTRRHAWPGRAPAARRAVARHARSRPSACASWSAGCAAARGCCATSTTSTSPASSRACARCPTARSTGRADRPPLDRPEIRRRMAARATRLGTLGGPCRRALRARGAARRADRRQEAALQPGARTGGAHRRRGARRDAAAPVSGPARRVARLADAVGARLARAGRDAASTTSTWRTSRRWPRGSKTAAARCTPSS